ncbi:MAG: hypothetical protein EXR02_09620 [Rhodospirillales bacterium]|nr:hypothetical protein [Rhodospirillales bacterium]MSP81300.1 hypothetical protein [Rhodospirillales bacterium]
MSLAIEGTRAWGASADPIRAADPQGGGASLSPWQALMASAALAQSDEAGGWHARIETGPARPSTPVVDDPRRIETAEARPTKAVPPDSKPPGAQAPKTNDPAASSAPDLSSERPPPPGLFENGDFSLADLLDVINPLQHIPIVSSLYRDLTGDRIGHGARLAGGVLFMGPLGGLSALANIVMLEASGKDVGDHAIALFKDDPAAATALAANSNAPAGGQKTESKSASISDEKALAELLPPGAIPLPGRSVEFTQAALRPGALAPNIQDPAANPAPGLSSWRPAPPGAIAPAPMSYAAASDDDLPPPPPPLGPIAGPGWKGFYSPPEPRTASVHAVPPADEQNIDSLAMRRSLAPDPMAALAAKRTPGAMAGTLAAPRLAPAGEPQAAPPGALAAEGGWFSDAMFEALAKYQDAVRLRGPQAPEAARPGGVNVVN